MRATKTHCVYILTAILALSRDVDAARILGLFPHTGKSHHMVFEPLLRKLAVRGHHVNVVSFFPAKNPPANYTDVSLEGIAALGVETIDMAYLEDPNLILDRLGLGSVYRQLMDFHPLAEMALSVCRKLVDWQPLKEALTKEYDLLIVENFNSDCMLGLAHVYGLKTPVVSLLSSGLMPWSAERIGVSDNPAYVPTISSNFAKRMTFFERLENTFALAAFKLWFRHAIQLQEQAIIEKHFGKRIPDLKDLAKNTSLMLVNTFHSLYGVRPTVPGLVEVGGMHLDPTRKLIPNWLEKFLNESEHGVVLFSFGSLIKTSTIPKHKEEIIVKVLSKLKQRVIWKYENPDSEAVLDGNILKVKWIPQYELLRHKKVVAVIAHGGMSGTVEAVSAGKPMVIVPLFGDQPLNGASAEKVGIAKVVSYADLSEKTLSEALESVLSAETRLNARRFAKIWRDRPAEPMDTAIYWIERIIRWGNQDNLHSPARNMSFIEYALLDVVAAIFFIIIVLIVALKFAITIIHSYITAGLSKKEKLA